MYNRLSGDVHLLPALHAEMLELISNGACGRELIDHLISEYSLDRETSTEFFNTLRREFSHLGLIDPLWN